MRNVIIIIAAVVIPPHPIERGVMGAKFDVDENISKFALFLSRAIIQGSSVVVSKS
jgi:hypothetical protein